MSLYYHTEYRLGKRGRISRSYTGFQALAAIVFDLAFGLVFELVCLSLALATALVVWSFFVSCRMLVLALGLLSIILTTAVKLITLPFVWLHRAVTRFDSPASTGVSAKAIRKPEFAFGRDL
jgi:hypothetical protein